MKLGDKVEYIINIITLGKGKDIAQWIAIKLGYEDCGCDDRKNWLNEITRTRLKAVRSTNKNKN